MTKPGNIYIFLKFLFVILCDFSKNGNTYTQPWIGYSYRNKNGISDFCREVSLNTLSKSEVDNIDFVLRNGKNVKSEVG
jgi:hypothetical protein